MRALVNFIKSLFSREKKSMDYIKQNDSRLNDPIPAIGCFFRSCGIIAEMKTGKRLTAEEINAMWDWAKDTSRIGADDCVRDSASIATRALRVLGDKGRFIEVATVRDGKVQYYPAFRNTEYARMDAVIRKVRTGGKEGTHYKVVDTEGNVLEDPHEPAIEGLGTIYDIVYAYEARA